MKKKILFIVSNMESGGVSKSMSSLLNEIDTLSYDVDCFILNPKGIFMSTIPGDVNVISDERTSLIFSKFPQNLLKLLKNGFFVDAFIRKIAAFFMLFNKGFGVWILSKRIYRINKQYDLAVDYNGQHQLYYLIDYIKADKKVTFFHSDYAKWNYYYNFDKKYFPKVDRIFSISSECVQSLKYFFPSQKNKIGLLENVMSKANISKMADYAIDDELDKDVLAVLSIGHLSKSKGTPLALKTAKLLKDKGVLFKWYFIGRNKDPKLYTRLIKQYGIQNYIVIMGLKPNPYPYLKQADIFVHLSEFEGKSIALDEAKLFFKPIVVTNFSTVNDQFRNGDNATITSYNADEIAASIIELMRNQNLKEIYKENLKKDAKDNIEQVNKLYSLISH
jgi:glycosyltransferase involved in cell wall biosynthesis